MVAGSIPIGALFGESARFFFADCHFYSHTVGYGAGAGFVLFFFAVEIPAYRNTKRIFFEMLFRWVMFISALSSRSYELGLDIPAFFALHRLLSSAFCDKKICWVLAGISTGTSSQDLPAVSHNWAPVFRCCSGSRSAAGSGLQIPLAPSQPDLRSRRAKNGGSAIPNQTGD